MPTSTAPAVLASLLASSALLASPAAAQAPAVAVDIAPVHSLVAQVMGDRGSPALIMPQGASPHHHSMRPSEARILQDAEVVVWIGPSLTPWLDDAIDTMSGDAAVVTLVEGGGHHDGEEGHDDHDDHGGGEEHAEGDGHNDHGGEEEHGEAHADAHGHGHGGVDPHAWLDTAVTGRWLGEIAEALAAADPEGAAVYEANAAEALARMEALEAEIAEGLAPVRDRPFVVFHDGYDHYADAFGLTVAGSLLTGDEAPPSPTRMAEIRDVLTGGAACFMGEPGADAGLIETATEGTDAVVREWDLLGSEEEIGPELHARTMRAMTETLVDCLGDA